ncbi:transport system inner membrane protein [Striga asiatica]|uniref:Transport system inner membrane protein n=1 Tax=Striga asiatica TaxID=4170 RepID=A0A5A7PY47_STRAF|nr:transport system inner membrane protein [Striga asiatica]
MIELKHGLSAGTVSKLDFSLAPLSGVVRVDKVKILRRAFATRVRFIVAANSHVPTIAVDLTLIAYGGPSDIYDFAFLGVIAAVRQESRAREGGIGESDNSGGLNFKDWRPEESVWFTRRGWPGTMVSVGWSKLDQTAPPEEFVSTRLPDSSREAAETPRSAVAEDQRGAKAVGEERSWRSPEWRRRRTAEELAGGPACQTGTPLWVTAAIRVPAGVGTKEREKVPLGERQLELGSAAESVEPRGMPTAEPIRMWRMRSRKKGFIGLCA